MCMVNTRNIACDVFVIYFLSLVCLCGMFTVVQKKIEMEKSVDEGLQIMEERGRERDGTIDGYVCMWRLMQ